MVLLKGYPEVAATKRRGVKTGPAAGRCCLDWALTRLHERRPLCGPAACGPALVEEVPSGCGFRRTALHRCHAAHRPAPWSPTGVLQRPTSAPGPKEGAPDRWWCRLPTTRSFGGTEDGVDFGDQRYHHRGVVHTQSLGQLFWRAGVRRRRRRNRAVLHHFSPPCTIGMAPTIQECVVVSSAGRVPVPSLDSVPVRHRRFDPVRRSPAPFCSMCR